MKRSQVGRIKKLASDDDDGGNKFMRTVMADYWHISMEIRQWLCGTTHTRSKSVRPEDTDEMKWENECGRQWDGVSQSVSQRERERERDISNEIEWCSVCKWWKIPSPGSLCVCECVCVWVWVCEREREGEKDVELYWLQKQCEIHIRSAKAIPTEDFSQSDIGIPNSH